MELSQILYVTLFALLATLLCYWHFCRGAKSVVSAAGVAAAAPSAAPAGQELAAGPNRAAGS
jgi:hypothetical protein